MIITPANTPITIPAIAPPEREEESLSDVLDADVAAGVEVGWGVGAAASIEEEEEEDVTDSGGGDATTNGSVDDVVVVAVIDDIAEGKASMLCVWLLANENPMSTSNE